MDFPIENGDFHSYVSLPEGTIDYTTGTPLKPPRHLGLGGGEKDLRGQTKSSWISSCCSISRPSCSCLKGGVRKALGFYKKRIKESQFMVIQSYLFAVQLDVPGKSPLSCEPVSYKSSTAGNLRIWLKVGKKIGKDKTVTPSANVSNLGTVFPPKSWMMRTTAQFIIMFIRRYKILTHTWLGLAQHEQSVACLPWSLGHGAIKRGSSSPGVATYEVQAPQRELDKGRSFLLYRKIPAVSTVIYRYILNFLNPHFLAHPSQYCWLYYILIISKYISVNWLFPLNPHLNIAGCITKNNIQIISVNWLFPLNPNSRHLNLLKNIPIWMLPTLGVHKMPTRFPLKSLIYIIYIYGCVWK